MANHPHRSSPMFLYFVSTDENRFGDAEVDHYGLRYAIDRVKIGRVRTGPDGKPGVIVVDRESPVPPKYSPEEQTWRARHGDDRVWIGHPGDRPPRAEMTARSCQLPGTDVTLADRSRILVPFARRWIEHGEGIIPWVSLPKTLKRNDDGDWLPSDVVGPYRHLWKMVTEFLDARETAIREADSAPGESIYFRYERINDLAIAAITANYRIGPDELEIMGAYDERVRDAVIDVLLDEATRDAWIKKKLAGSTADGGSSSDGHAPPTTASTSDTSPPSPTSGPTAKGCTETEPTE